MSNAHYHRQQQQQQHQRSQLALAMRMRAPRAAWAAGLAASAAAATSAHHTDDAYLESDSHRHRIMGAGAAATERFTHRPTGLHLPHQHSTAITEKSAIERETALAKRQSAWPTTPTTTTAITTAPPATQASLPPPTIRMKKITTEYDLQGVIGEGGFGCVHIARHRATNTQVAIKRVFKTTTSRDKFLQEVAILQHVSSSNNNCNIESNSKKSNSKSNNKNTSKNKSTNNKSTNNHNNVLQLRDAFETPDAYVLVTELVTGGELFDDLVLNGAFDEHRAMTLVRELATTLAFLHDKQVVHGDVKPENILLGDDVDATMRLIDFGQAFRADHASERARVLNSSVGTTAYAAPEFLSQRVSSSAVDLWALGAVLYVVLCGVHPFDPTNTAEDDEIAQRICTGDFARDLEAWTQLSAPARDLVERLLTVDPSARLTAEQVLAHEWLDGCNSSSNAVVKA